MQIKTTVKKLQRFLYQLLFLSIILLQLNYEDKNVQAYNCFKPQLPLTIGSTQGNTDVQCMDVSPQGEVYVAGVTDASDLIVQLGSKAVYVAKYDASGIAWLKVIDSAQVNAVEFLSLMSDTSKNLFLYASGSGNPYEPLLFIINKNDGSIVHSSQFTGSQVIPPSENDYKYQQVVAKDPTKVILVINGPNKNYKRLLKFSNVSQDFAQDWFIHNDQSGVENPNFNAITAIEISQDGNDVFYSDYFNYRDSQGGCFQELALKTFNIENQDDGYKYKFELYPADPDISYEIRNILNFGTNGDSLMGAGVSNKVDSPLYIFSCLSWQTQAQENNNIKTFHFSNPNPADGPFNIKGISSDSINKYQVYVYFTDKSNKNYILQIIFDKQNPSQITSQIRQLQDPISQDQSFIIQAVKGFMIAGKTKKIQTSAKSQSFSTETGFVINADTSSTDQNCISFSDNNAWQNSNEFSTNSQQQSIQSSTIIQLLPFGYSQFWILDSSYSSAISKTIATSPYKNWCTKASNLKINPGQIDSQIFYNSGDQELKLTFTSPFSLNDTQCDAFSFTYSISTTATSKAGSSATGITNFPAVVKGATPSLDYLSVITNNYKDSEYNMSVSLTATLPDSSQSSTISTNIIVNYAKSSQNQGLNSVFIFPPWDKLTFILQNKNNYLQDYSLNLENYFQIDKNSNSFTSCQIVDSDGNQFSWITVLSLKDSKCYFSIDKSQVQPQTNVYLKIISNTMSSKSQAFKLSVNSCSSSKIKLANPSQDIDSKKIHLSNRQNPTYQVSLEKFFDTTQSNDCPITNFEIVKVVQKNSGQEVSSEKWSDLFSIDSETRVFRVQQAIQSYQSYLIYIEGQNEIGTKGGSQQYLFDVSYQVFPYFKQSLPDIVLKVSKEQTNEITFLLPEVSSDVISIEVTNQKIFQFMKVTQSNILIDTSQIGQNNFGNKKVILKIKSKYEEAEYSFNLLIQPIVQDSVEDKNEQQSDYSQNLEETKILGARIVSVDSLSNMIMEFNDTLNLEGIQPSYINSTNTNIKILPYQDPNSNQTLNLTKYELTWETTELTKNRWKVKMNFSEPNQISQYLTQDQIQVAFFRSWKLLKSKNTNQTLHQDYQVLTKKIQPQMVSTEAVQMLANFMENTSQLAMIQLVLGTLFQVIGAGDSYKFKMLVRTLSFLVRLPMLMPILPPFANQFLKNFVAIVQFNLLEFFFDWRNQNVINFDFEGQSLQPIIMPDQFINLGYETHNFLITLPTISLLILFFAVKFVLKLLLTIWIKFTKGQLGGQRMLAFLNFQALFTEQASFSLEAQFELLICGYFGLSKSLQTALGEWLSIIFSGYSSFLGLILINFILLKYIIRKNSIFETIKIEQKSQTLDSNQKEEERNKIIAGFNELFIQSPDKIQISESNSEETQAQREARHQKEMEEIRNYYSEIFEKNVMKTRFQRSYHFVLSLKRTLFVVIGIFLFDENKVAPQVVCILLLNLFVMMYIVSAEALEGRSYNLLDTINESFIVFIFLHIIAFTEFLDNLDLKEIIGWSMNGSLLIILAINLIAFQIDFLHTMKLLFFKFSRRCCRFVIKRRYQSTPTFLTNVSEFFQGIDDKNPQSLAFIQNMALALQEEVEKEKNRKKKKHGVRFQQQQNSLDDQNSSGSSNQIDSSVTLQNEKNQETQNPQTQNHRQSQKTLKKLESMEQFKLRKRFGRLNHRVFIKLVGQNKKQFLKTKLQSIKERLTDQEESLESESYLESNSQTDNASSSHEQQIKPQYVEAKVKKQFFQPNEMQNQCPYFYKPRQDVTLKFDNEKVVAGNIRQLMSHPVLVDPKFSEFRVFLIDNLDAFFDSRLRDPHWSKKLQLDPALVGKIIDIFIDSQMDIIKYAIKNDDTQDVKKQKMNELKLRIEIHMKIRKQEARQNEISEEQFEVYENARKKGRVSLSNLVNGWETKT